MTKGIAIAVMLAGTVASFMVLWSGYNSDTNPTSDVDQQVEKANDAVQQLNQSEQQRQAQEAQLGN